MAERIRSKITRGSGELAILSMLAEQPFYGFEIARQIGERTGGALKFTLASLYPLLYEMEKRGWVEGRWQANPAGRDRRYYRLPPADAANWLRSVKNGAPSSKRSTASPESVMPDWKKLVREGSTGASSPEMPEPVMDELAAHREDSYEEARSRGLTNEAAFESTLQEVNDWHVLAAEIQRATREENSMNNRTKTFWLPALTAFVLASLFQLALTRIGAQPQSLVRLTSGLGPWLYAGWLLAQILCGAAGGFLSRRTGGTVLTRILASVFPAIVMLGLWGVVIPLSAFLQNNLFVLRHPLYYASGVFPAVALPAVALLLGALPFLREPSRAEPAKV